MLSEEIESTLREYYTTGVAYQQLQLELTIKKYHHDNDRMNHIKMTTEALRIRRDQEWGLMACPVEPGSMSMYDNEFLSAAAKVSAIQRRMYRPTFFYSWLIEHDINPLRERYMLSPQDSRELTHCPQLAQSETWTDEELLIWLGRYEYITSSADTDLRRYVDEIFGIEPSVEISALETEPTNIETAPTTTAVLDDSEKVDPKKYNAREACIAFFLLLEGMSEGCTLSMNIDAAAILLSKIHGGSVDNIDRHLTVLRLGHMTLGHVQLDDMQALFESTKIRISYDVLKKIADNTVDLEATPPQLKVKKDSKKRLTAVEMRKVLLEARANVGLPEQTMFEQALERST